MSIVLLTGSYPPEICGVGDYTYKLYNYSNKERWKLCHIKSWSLKSIPRIIRKIDKLTPSSIILQYPTEGYGWSLVPHILAIYYSLFSRKQFIVALHEFSNMSFKAKLATFLFFFSNKVVFTTDFERINAIKVAPWLRKRAYVINIISNIGKPYNIKKWEERSYDIVYFGHLRPNKGLEDFYSVIEQLSIEYEIRICVIGQVLNQYSEYFSNLRKKYNHLNIKYQIGKPSEKVTELLNDSKVCFLPFPDGLSERRGSFLAAISCGAISVSYSGKFVTPPLKKIAQLVTPKSAKEKIAEILQSTSTTEHKDYCNACQLYLTTNIPGDWSEIVKRYEEVEAQKG